MQKTKKKAPCFIPFYKVWTHTQHNEPCWMTFMTLHFSPLACRGKKCRNTQNVISTPLLPQAIKVMLSYTCKHTHLTQRACVIINCRKMDWIVLGFFSIKIFCLSAFMVSHYTVCRLGHLLLTHKQAFSIVGWSLSACSLKSAPRPCVYYNNRKAR